MERDIRRGRCGAWLQQGGGVWRGGDGRWGGDGCSAGRARGGRGAGRAEDGRVHAGDTALARFWLADACCFWRAVDERRRY